MPLYRNDSDTSYIIPYVGEIHAGQRVSYSGEFPVNLENFPGVVDVEAEEAAGKARDYEKSPEVVTNTLNQVAPEPPKETQNG